MRLFKSIRNWFLSIPLSGRWALILFFAFGFFAKESIHYLMNRKPQVTEAVVQDRPVPVATDTIRKRTIQNQFFAHSFLQPRKEIILRPNSNVSVREVKVEVGQFVQKGQVLAYTDSEAQALRAELDQIDLKMRNLDFNVTVALAKKSFLSKKEYREKELEHRAVQIRKRLSEIDTTGSMISPIAGVISEVSLKTGDFIDNPQQYFIKIADASSFRVQLYLPQSVASHLKKGDPAELSHSKTDELGKETNQVTLGKIETVAPVVDPKTGSILTEIEVGKIPEGWISGMYVQVTLTVEQSTNVIAIPNESLVFENNQAYIYRVPSDSQKRNIASTDQSEHVQKIAVKTGMRDAKFTEIQQGLEEFDLIVTEGQGNLSDGAKVEIIR